MPSLNLDLDFLDHPKIKRLIARTGYEGVVCLLKLWCHAGKFHKIDGSLASYTDDEIEQFAGWSGVRGALLQALLAVSLLDADKTIHDWHDHAGHLAAYQAQAKRMAKARWDSAKRSPSNAPSTTPSNATSGQVSSFSESKDSEADASGDGLERMRSPEQKDHDTVVEYLRTRFGDESPKSIYSQAGAIFKPFRSLGATGSEMVWIITNRLSEPESVTGLIKYIQKVETDSKMEMVSEARKNVGPKRLRA